jgi:hypothetical protein
MRQSQIDEGFAEDDLEANLQRDKYARLTTAVNLLIDELTPSAPDFQLRDACDQLVSSMSCSTHASAGDVLMALLSKTVEYRVRRSRDAESIGLSARDACNSGSFGGTRVP